MNFTFCKRFVLTTAVLLALVGLGVPVIAEHDAFAVIEDNPKLPRALLIGDSISIGYTGSVRRALEGKANVHRIRTNARSTKEGLKNLSAWLDDGNWDVIHFNWGLHDLFCKIDTETNEKKHRVDIDEYEQNLNELVTKLKSTGAKLIWASTTPVPGNGCSNEDVMKYNEVAQHCQNDSRMPQVWLGLAEPLQHRCERKSP